MTSWITLSDLTRDDEEQVVAVLADWCEQSGNPRPLGRALAGGDLLGGRDPASVPPDVRNRIAAVLTRHVPPSPCPAAPCCPHLGCRDDGRHGPPGNN
jgi:hypothetical protein